MKFLVKLSHFQVQEKMLRNLLKERRLALQLIVFGNIVSIFWFLFVYLVISPPILVSPWDALDYTLTWDMLPILFIIFSVIRFAFKQIMTNEHSMDAKPTQALNIYQTSINTLIIQLCLFIPVHIAIAFSLPNPCMSIVPAAAIFFVFGAWIYHVGFTLRPLLRFFGLSCMLTPTLIGCFFIITTSFFIF